MLHGYFYKHFAAIQVNGTDNLTRVCTFGVQTCTLHLELVATTVQDKHASEQLRIILHNISVTIFTVRHLDGLEQDFTIVLKVANKLREFVAAIITAILIVTKKMYEEATL